MRSDDSEQFAAYLYEWLTTNNPYNKLEVFRYDDDVSFGHRECSSLIMGLYISFVISNYIGKVECGPMPNVMAALPNISGALCSTPQSLADAQYWSAVQ